MQLTGSKRQKRLLEKINESKIGVNEPQLWLAILLLALPTPTNTAKIKLGNDNKDNTSDLHSSNKSKDISPFSDHRIVSIFSNTHSKNESYLNKKDDRQTNESSLRSVYVNNSGTSSITNDNHTHKVGNNIAQNKENLKSENVNLGQSASKIDTDNNTKIIHEGRHLQRKIIVDGKLDLLPNTDKDFIKEGKRKIQKIPVKANNKNQNSEIKIEQRDITNAIDYGIKALEELVKIKEPQLYKLGLFLDKNQPAAKVATFGAPLNQKAILMSRAGYATLVASKKIAESYPQNVGRQSAGIPNSLQSRIDIDGCPLTGQPRCPPASRRFRTSDGTCNNLKHPWRGSAMLPMQRYLPPVYEDGIQSVRRSVFGEPLPSARQVSTVIHRDRNQEIQSVTMMFTQWGQFIDHDITSTVKARSFNGSIPRCCDTDERGVLPPDLLHPSCLPIEVPRNDPFLSQFGIGCMEFIRSAPSTRINCELGWREQINQVTPYIDASTIYGSDIDTSDSIRTFRNGQIVYGRSHNPLNPPDPPEGELCRAGALSEECLQPGDGRVSETPGLIAMHTVFVRYHNKVATVLSNINPHWSDEKVYQETRKIVYSVIQHITYREYLPVVLGPEVMNIFELRVLGKGFYDKYDKRIIPDIANSFASAAFRFGHSMVQNSFLRTDSDHIPLPNNVSLHEEISNFNHIWTFGSVDRILLGFFNQPSQRRDEFIAKELTNHLFQFSDATPFGMDLAAINIQRGRDHGIPPYTFWRKPCGLSPIMDWRDLEKVMSINSVIRLKTLYHHVDDVDLFTGGLAEKPLRGGVVGPTFACIIAQQFSNLRKGDRFWYENDGFESSFSPAQLQQIRRVSLAQIICQTTDEIETIQPFVFLSTDQTRNVRVDCDSPDIRNFDLGAWTERSFEFNSISENLDSFQQDRSQTDYVDLIRRRRRVTRRNQKTKTNITRDAATNKPIMVSLKRPRHIRERSNNSSDLKRHRRNTHTTKKNTITTSTDGPKHSTHKSKTKTKTSIIKKLPNKTRTTTLKPFHVTSVPFEVKRGNFNGILKKYSLAKVITARPTKDKPQYYQIQDQNHNDVTFLIGILPERTTKAPPSASPLQVNINIHYSQHSTATTTPVSFINKKKHPSVTTNPNPLTYDYTSKPILTGSYKPTNLYGESDVVIITKRPVTTKRTRRPVTPQNIDVSYPVFIYDPPKQHYNKRTTTNPTYSNDFVTTKIKRPNLSGYGVHQPVQVKPSPGYYYNDDERYTPINNKPTTVYHPEDAYVTNFDKKPLSVITSGYDSDRRPAVFENKPFSTSNQPLSTDFSIYNVNKHSDKRPFSNYHIDNDNTGDVVVITKKKKQPQTSTYNRDETSFNDDILNGFFNRHTDKDSDNKNYGVTKTDGKLDFKSRIVFKTTDIGNPDTDSYVEISSIKKEENFENEDHLNRESTDEFKRKLGKMQKRRSVKRIRVVDVDVMPSESRNQWKYFIATEEPNLDMEVPELPVNMPCSYEIPKPMNFLPSAARAA